MRTKNWFLLVYKIKILSLRKQKFVGKIFLEEKPWKNPAALLYGQEIPLF